VCTEAAKTTAEAWGKKRSCAFALWPVNTSPATMAMRKPSRQWIKNVAD
jgi:hypothetical protein